MAWIPPKGTAEPNPVSRYIFNHQLNTWQTRQTRERPINEIGHTNVGSSVRPTFQVEHADQHGKTSVGVSITPISKFI